MNTFNLCFLRKSPLRHLSCSTSLSLSLEHSQRLFLSSTSSLPQKRHASSAPVIITTNPPPSPRDRINGPLSTLPPPLVFPERQPGLSWFSHYVINRGKIYLRFYKGGLKAVYHNYKASRPIRAKIKSTFNNSIDQAIEASYLDRSKFQLLKRSWFDIKRIPIFAMFFIVFGEFTPLVVVFASSVVPYTCRIPKQIEKDRMSLEERRAVSFRNLTTPLPNKNANVDNLERMQLLHISWSLGLSSSAWDWLGGRLPGLPTPFLRSKVEKRVEYLDRDDNLIKIYGGVKRMSTEEVRVALEERGIDLMQKNESQQRDALRAWMRARNVAPTLTLLLSRPSVWPSKK